MSIDPGSDRSYYRQLADILRDQILTGAIPPGGQLPSEHHAATEYGVGRETVRQAVALLRGEGLVTTARGTGTRVRTAATRVLIRLGRGDRAIARMPTDPERREHQVDEGVPIIEIHRADGQTELHPADRVELGRH